MFGSRLTACIICISYISDGVRVVKVFELIKKKKIDFPATSELVCCDIVRLIKKPFKYAFGDLTLLPNRFYFPSVVDYKY